MDTRITVFALIIAVIITGRNMLLEHLDAKYKYKKQVVKCRVKNKEEFLEK